MPPGRLFAENEGFRFQNNCWKLCYNSRSCETNKVKSNPARRKGFDDFLITNLWEIRFMNAVSNNSFASDAKNVVLAACACVAAMSAGSAGAVQTTAQLAVSAAVKQNCTISTTALAFGDYDPVTANSSTALTGTATVTITCSKGTTTGGSNGPQIGLSTGGHPSGSIRRMEHSVSTGVFLIYELYKPTTNAPGAVCPAAGSGTIWTDVTPDWLVTDIPADKNARTYNICGVVSAGQDAPVGNYTDTVTATVNF